MGKAMQSSGRYVVLYDGRCSFCTAQSQRLRRLARQGVVELVDFQEPGVLTRFPGVTYDACMKAMHLVRPDGRVYRGFEAIMQTLATRPLFRGPAYLYYVPGIRQICDLAYRWIAAHRYALFSKSIAQGQCADGTCALHLRDQP